MLVHFQSPSSDKDQLLASNHPACNEFGGSQTTSSADPPPQRVNLVAAASTALTRNLLEEKKRDIPYLNPVASSQV